MRNKKPNAIAATILLLGAMGCSNIKVTSQSQPGADLAGLRTFSWGQQPTGPKNSIIHEQIEKTVIAELSKLGIEAAPPGRQPDFLVSYDTSITNVVSQSSAG